MSTDNTIWFGASAYLLFCASGLLAVVKYFTMPYWSDYSKAYDKDGIDISWCELTVMAIFSLIPIFNLAANLFWLCVLRQQIKRRPLIKWPHFKAPKYRLPKCSVAVRGKRCGGDL